MYRVVFSYDGFIVVSVGEDKVIVMFDMNMGV